MTQDTADENSLQFLDFSLEMIYFDYFMIILNNNLKGFFILYSYPYLLSFKPHKNKHILTHIFTIIIFC